MESTNSCIFCRIAAGQTEEKLLYDDGEVTAFADNQPRTPIHILVTPKHHYHDFDEMMAKEPELLGKIGVAVEKLVDQLGIKGQWYTWGFHCGGKQSVHHIHAQLLAGMKPDELVL